MSAVINHAKDLLVPAFPAAVNTHWETMNCFVWNVHERASEEREFVYELGTWRRFLRSQ